MSGLMIPRKRRVFFSFHYQNDVWRANQVRNSWRYQHETTREAEGFFDGSLWESSKRTSPDSLKDLIRVGMGNTSVTAVLIGSNTFERRWVRYELARSIIKGNGLVGVRVHGLRDQQGYASAEGPNPLDYMGVYRVADGRILLAEWKDGGWVRYADYTQAVTLPAAWLPPNSTNVVELSTYANTYCYVTDGGAQCFSGWIQSAATAAGR